MKVLYWTERFWPHIGGIEVLSLLLIEALRDKGHEFRVVTSHNEADLPDEDVYKDILIHRFHFLTSLTSRDLKRIRAARESYIKFKLDFKPDLIHIHFSGPSSYFHMQTLSVHPSLTLITLHSIPVRISANSKLLLETLRKASWVTGSSEWSLERVRKLAPEINPRSSFIHNALEDPSVKLEELRFESPRILCLGRLVSWKGFDSAIKAFSYLFKQFPKARLIIAGDGPEKHNLEIYAKNLEIKHSVEFTGWVVPDKVLDLVNTATVVLIPSKEGGGENLPTVALQAMQMGRPIVATRIAGLSELVSHMKTGILVQQDNLEELIQAIAYILSNTGKAMQMGTEARNLVNEKFSLKNCVEEYDRLYKHIAKN